MKISPIATKAIKEHYGVSDITDILETQAAMLNDSVVDGFCVKCGCNTDGVEPDARDYECPDCGERSVCSIVEILLF